MWRDSDILKGLRGRTDGHAGAQTAKASLVEAPTSAACAAIIFSAPPKGAIIYQERSFELHVFGFSIHAGAFAERPKSDGTAGPVGQHAAQSLGLFRSPRARGRLYLYPG